MEEYKITELDKINQAKNDMMIMVDSYIINSPTFDRDKVQRGELPRTNNALGDMIMVFIKEYIRRYE